jgi:hypothetical protein
VLTFEDDFGLGFDCFAEPFLGGDKPRHYIVLELLRRTIIFAAASGIKYL